MTTIIGTGSLVIWDSNESGQTDEVMHSLIDSLLDCSVSLVPLPKPDPLDVKYPHECHNPKCRCPLSFKELLDRNAFIHKSNPNKCGVGIYNYKTYKHLKKLWKCRHVQFLCCRCYEEMFEKSTP